MPDSFDFIGGILLGTFLGSFATLIYHVRRDSPRKPAKTTFVSPSLTQKFSPWSEHWKSIAAAQPPISDNLSRTLPCRSMDHPTRSH